MMRVSPSARRRRISAAPRSEEPPTTRTSSRLMDGRPDRRPRDGLAPAVHDRRLDFHAPVSFGEMGDLAGDGEAIADEGGRLELDVEAVEERKAAGQVHADERRVERRGEEAERHPAG